MDHTCRSIVVPRYRLYRYISLLWKFAYSSERNDPASFSSQLTESGATQPSRETRKKKLCWVSSSEWGWRHELPFSHILPHLAYYRICFIFCSSLFLGVDTSLLLLYATLQSYQSLLLVSTPPSPLLLPASVDVNWYKSIEKKCIYIERERER